jgi:LacI family transcriptional regulator
MATGLTQAIGVVVANIEDEFFARIVRGVADVAREAGYDVILANSDESADEEKRATRMLAERQVDGLIVAPASSGASEHLGDVLDFGLPLVLLDRNVEGLGADAVVIDGMQAAAAATEYLIDLGHREIAIIADFPSGTEPPSAFAVPAVGTTSGARLAGYLETMRMAEIPIQDDLIGRALTTEAARKQAHAVLNRAAPTAIFATDNTITLGVLECLQERGISVPGQMSLFGFDNLEWTKVTFPPISVVSQPMYDLGATAARLLLERIEGSDDPPHVEVLPTRLVHRGSVGVPRRD